MPGLGFWRNSLRLDFSLPVSQRTPGWRALVEDLLSISTPIRIHFPSWSFRAVYLSRHLGWEAASLDVAARGWRWIPESAGQERGVGPVRMGAAARWTPARPGMGMRGQCPFFPASALPVPSFLYKLLCMSFLSEVQVDISNQTQCC